MARSEVPARITPTTPVPAMPVMISSTPKDFSFSWTIAEVRNSCIDSSGCACRSWRHSVMSAWNSAIRLMMGIQDSFVWD